MDPRFRLVLGGQPREYKRVGDRRRLQIPGQIVWKDARGTTRMASVVTRDVSEHGVAVDCLSGTPIPLYRLVYFQIDRSQRQRPDLPVHLRGTHVLSAVYRVDPCSSETGLPRGYALRLLVEPETTVVVSTRRERPAAHRSMTA